MKSKFAPIAIAMLCCVFAVNARAQQLSQEDKDKALLLLETTKNEVLDATKGLTPAQWNFKPAPDRWSIAECMEHIAAAEDYIRGNIVEKIMAAPAAPGRDVEKIDAGILSHVADRSQKVQAPEPLKPTNRFGTPQAAIDHFVESRAKTEEFVKNTADLRAHAVPPPGQDNGTKWDAYEFVLLIGAHSERHTKQMLEVKADPNFPKG